MKLIPINIWYDISSQTDAQVWRKWSLMTGKIQDMSAAHLTEPVWQDISRHTFAKTRLTLTQASAVIKARMSHENTV